ncbi:MAG: hypothetical protein ACI9HK_001624 [Pirellulaceae bacterium]
MFQYALLMQSSLRSGSKCAICWSSDPALYQPANN